MLNHYNDMVWHNPIRVDLLAVDVHEIPIGDERDPMGPAAQPQFMFGNKTREPVGKGLGAIHSARAGNVMHQFS